jgi:hypothetical protein
MGSDPGRLRGLRPDERLVALALERATGASARALDVGGAQGAVDLLLTYPDGRTAAVEVTSHARDGVRRRDAGRRGGRGAWPDPSRPWWTATGPSPPGDLSLEGLPGAVDRLLDVPSIARRAAKVAGVPDVDERHLVVELGEGGLPPRLYAALAAPGTPVPRSDPTVPDGLSHVWLTAGWGGSPLVGWRRGEGWCAHQDPGGGRKGRRGGPGERA